ncbi:MAG TPA: hypothetical protein VFG60_09770 [Burkholderiaceae bacterium]|nr:hypothetical protein [Burkholderiaceae bacterium]
MKHARAALALGLGLSLVSVSAPSQVVYRCGNAYSQAPCPRATIVDVSDPRSATQRAEARTVAVQQHQLATAMARDRRVREREQVAQRASGFDSRAASPAAAASAHEPRKKKHRASSHRSRQGADFIAIVPGSGKKPVRPPA